jgi:uncharacterized repeat protein (TIGR01451 family)
MPRMCDLMCASKLRALPRRILLAELVLLLIAVQAFVSVGAGPLRSDRNKRMVSSRMSQVTGAFATGRRALDIWAQQPLHFEPNVGQAERHIRYLARASSYALYFSNHKAELLLPRRYAANQSGFRALSFELLGSNPVASVIATQELFSKSNYLLGNEPRRWHRNVPHFTRIRYEQVYPGVDLVYYGRQQQLEYDFVLSPGADPRHLRFRVHGADVLSVDRNGDLVLQVAGGTVRWHKPKAYQRIGSTTQFVSASYTLSGRRVGFSIGHYDRRRELIIDPTLSYSTYLGGTGDETNTKVVIDVAGNAYIAGTTASLDFPKLKPLQASLKGTSDIFVTKFTPSGSSVYFSTYLGGNGSDSVAGIAVDISGNAYLAGTTTSTNFPTTSSAAQATPKAPGTHVFVAELRTPGDQLLYSTYLSGSSMDVASGVALGPSAGKIFVTGTTTSANFPTTPGVLQPTKPAGTTSQFFISSLDTAQSGSASLVYSTYLGGRTPASAQTTGGGIAVDLNSNAYVTGGTTYTDFPVVNAAKAQSSGGVEAFVTKLNPTGTAPPVFSTFLGGTGDDSGNAIAVDRSGNVFLTGSTTSTDFPTNASAVQRTPGGGTDAFVTKFVSSGQDLIYSTYLGGGGDDLGQAIAVDSNQNASVAGSTESADFPTVSPTQGYGGGSDAFVAKLDPVGTAQFLSFLGGSSTDHGTGVATDLPGNTYVVGDTTSTDFPVANAAHPALTGGSDAFVTKFVGVSDLSLAASVTPVPPSPVGVGAPASFTFTVTNGGPDLATGVTVRDVLPGGATFQSSSSNQGSCEAPAGSPSTVVCTLGAMGTNGTATVTVVLASGAAGTLIDGASVSSNSSDPDTSNNSASANIGVTDFEVNVSPATATVTAGDPAGYTVLLSPVTQGASFPNQISLNCPKGVPTGASCIFSSNPITPNGSPVTSALTISTTARPATTTAQSSPGGVHHLYPVFVSIAGMFFLGAAGSRQSRRRKCAQLLGIVVLVGLGLLQAGCGGGSSTPTTPTGTPAGTYTITVQGTSGTVNRTNTLKLVVK